MIKISLNKDDFKNLIKGKIIELEGVQIALQDIGYSSMLGIIHKTIDEQNTLNHRFRTLVRVENIFGNNVHLIIPGWNPRKEVIVDKTQIPFEVKDLKYFFAEVNLEAPTQQELLFDKWEIGTVNK